MTTKALEKPKEHAAPVAKTRPIAVSPWESEFDRFLDEFRSPFSSTWARRFFRRGDLIQPPAIDMVDEKDHLVVKAELPGMGKDDVDVELTDSTLIISGEKKAEKEVKEKDYYRSECEYGSIFRSIHLPVEVAKDSVTATFNNGVLEIRMTKAAPAKPNAVKVPVK
jgi:HSP20 family protein